MPDSNIDSWKGKYVEELVRCDPPPISPEEAERHGMYARGLLAIAHHYWNGNKYGRHLRYPLNTVVDPTAEGGPAGGTYLGHNIAALAVDADGRVIDFDFNHNEVFNSSVEHAESRLLRRLFSLTQIQDTWKTAGNGSVAATSQNEGYYGNLLSGVTLYTTLESCAQCSGIMALAKVKQVVYLQTDPGQYGVGNIMRNMTAGTGLPAPQPIAGAKFGFAIHGELDAAYAAFRNRGPGQPMVTDPSGTPTSDATTKSITSFLCTKAAQELFERAKEELATFVPQHGAFTGGTSALANTAVLEEVRGFVTYATTRGWRGTPHRA